MLLRLVKIFHQWRPKQNNSTLFEKIFIRIKDYTKYEFIQHSAYSIFPELKEIWILNYVDDVVSTI